MKADEIRALVQKAEPRLLALMDTLKRECGARLVALEVGAVRVGKVEENKALCERAIVPHKVHTAKELREQHWSISRSARKDREALRSGTETRRRAAQSAGLDLD